MADTGKCGHEMCNCVVGNDESFCSDHCREASEQDIPEIACDCGCPSCR